MKPIIALIAVLLLSCKKEIVVKPQVITYKVKCADCLIQIEDAKWNGYNELERSRSQYFNVTGEWEYSFANTDLDSVSARIYVGVFYPEQNIYVIISESKNNRKETFNGKLGIPKDPFIEYKNEHMMHLSLNQ